MNHRGGYKTYNFKTLAITYHNKSGKGAQQVLADSYVNGIAREEEIGLRIEYIKREGAIREIVHAVYPWNQMIRYSLKENGGK